MPGAHSVPRSCSITKPETKDIMAIGLVINNGFSNRFSNLKYTCNKYVMVLVLIGIDWEQVLDFREKRAESSKWA